MDDFIDILIRLLEQVEANFDEISDEEADSIAEFLQEAMGFLQEGAQAQQPSLPPTRTPDVEAPIPVGAELLWILAGGQEDAFVGFLRTYPDPSLNSLLRNPQLLMSTIDRLNRTMPQGARGSVNGIPEAPIDSSNIYGFQYDPKSGHLKVRFQSGSVYSYQGVPPGVFQVFKAGAVPAKTSGQNQYGRWWMGKLPSLGAAFYQMIRQGNYPYQRIS